MAFIKGKGTRNVKYVGDGNNKSWSLPKSPTTHYEAVCDYNGEILEVDLDPKYSSCSFKREASAVHTGCK